MKIDMLSEKLERLKIDILDENDLSEIIKTIKSLKNKDSDCINEKATV